MTAMSAASVSVSSLSSSKWNPSKEIEFPGQVVRYKDNFDVTNNLTVSIVKIEKSSIKDFGSPEELLKSVAYLLGKQSSTGETNSEVVREIVFRLTVTPEDERC